MRTPAIFMLAALTFIILAGAIEASWARRERRSLKEKSTVALHPLARHRLRRVRYPLPARALYHVSLFFGFLLVIYVGILLLKTIHSVVAHWF
jgi:hypothetical protein